MNGHATMLQKTINTGGWLLDLSTPKVMAIVNVTTDSFATHCTNITETEVLRVAAKALQEGADVLDLGGCSTRPGSESPDTQEEWRRIRLAASAIRREWPEVVLSVDTYRAEVAKRAVEEYGVNIINDVSGGSLDPQMFETVSRLRVPYILTHMRGTPANMGTLTDYEDLMSDILAYFQERVNRLHCLGVKDIIIDPGFGFAKTTEQNYELLAQMRFLQVLDLPILTGLSRKSMIQKVLNVSADESLNGTTALHMLALQQGATLLRVHDVKEAKQVITLYNYYCNHGT